MHIKLFPIKSEKLQALGNAFLHTKIVYTLKVFRKDIYNVTSLTYTYKKHLLLRNYIYHTKIIHTQSILDHIRKNCVMCSDVVRNITLPKKSYTKILKQYFKENIENFICFYLIFFGVV